MCNTNIKLDNAFAEMEEAAARLSKIQEKVNTPLFDTLFALAEYPQDSTKAGVKVKTLHTYAHRFIEFYMTECPDGVSVHTVNASKVHDIAEKMRSLGDGLCRLCEYLALKSEADTLTEIVDTLALAYDTLSVTMTHIDKYHDEFDCDCDECDEDDEYCDDDCCCGECNEGCECNCETCNCQDNDEDEEDDISDAELDKLFGGFFKMLADSIEKQRAARSEAKQEPAKQFEQPATKVKPAPSTPSDEEMMKRIASIFGIKPEQIRVEKIPVQPVREEPKKDEAMEAAKRIAAMFGLNPAEIEKMCESAKPRQVAPGHWRIEF